MEKTEQKKSQDKPKRHYVAVSGEMTYNSDLSGQAYARVTVSINHSDPKEVFRVRNMLETKALEVNEQYKAEAKQSGECRHDH